MDRLIVEYIAGFAFGLFIFQALFMKNMMGGTYWENVRKRFMPEFISMNFMMAGMAPVMCFLMMGRDMRAMEPTELLFWGVMSLGVIGRLRAAYPFNVWLVAKGLKHGLMTERKPGIEARPWRRCSRPDGARGRGAWTDPRSDGHPARTGRCCDRDRADTAPIMPPGIRGDPAATGGDGGLHVLMLVGGFANPFI